MGEWEETIKELNPTTDGHNGENTSKYKELQKKLDNLEKTFQSIRNAKLVTEDIPEYKEIQAKLNQWETTIKGLKIERYEAMEKKLNNVEKELAALRLVVWSSSLQEGLYHMSIGFVGHMAEDHADQLLYMKMPGLSEMLQLTYL